MTDQNISSSVGFCINFEMSVELFLKGGPLGTGWKILDSLLVYSVLKDFFNLIS